MSGFSAAWLDLREAADGAARADVLCRILGDSLPAQPSGELRIRDLGCGTGANLRYLAPRLGGRQRWHLIDHDARLLEVAAARMGARGRRGAVRPAPTGSRHLRLRLGGPRWQATADLERLDLASAADSHIVPCGTHLLCATALLDLAGRRWLWRTLRACRGAGAAALFTLTYDGRTSFWPRDPLDRDVLALVNRHQRRDKGLGPALGPAAAGFCARRLVALGYRVHRRHSDWRLTPADGALQSALIEGWTGAAMQMAPDRAATLSGWRERRCGAVARGESWLRVGHVDLLALPR